MAVNETANLTINVDTTGIDSLNSKTEKLGSAFTRFASSLTQTVAGIALVAGSSEKDIAKLQKQLNLYLGVITIAGTALKTYESATKLATAAQLALNTAMGSATTTGAKLTNVLKYAVTSVSGIGIAAGVAVAALGGLIYGMISTMNKTNDAIDTLGDFDTALANLASDPTYISNLNNVTDKLDEALNSWKVSMGLMTQADADAAKKQKEIAKESATDKLKIASDYQVEYAKLSASETAELEAIAYLNKEIYKSQDETSYEFEQKQLERKTEYTEKKSTIEKKYHKGVYDLQQQYIALGAKLDEAATLKSETLSNDLKNKKEEDAQAAYDAYIAGLKTVTTDEKTEYVTLTELLVKYGDELKKARESKGELVKTEGLSTYTDKYIALSKKRQLEIESETESLQEMISTVDNTITAISTIGSSIENIFGQGFKNAQISSDNYYSSEYESLDKLYEYKRISEEEYNKRKEKLDKKRSDDEKEIRIKEAKAEKASSMFSIITDTARAIMATVGETGFLGSPLAMIMAALGAAQLAIVTAQPIPKFGIGGIVPGQGNSDNQVAMLTPGEFVMNKSVTQQNYPLLKELNKGNLNLADEIAFKLGKQIQEIQVVNVATETTRVSDNVNKIRNKAKLR